VDGALWIGTYGLGLARLDKNGRWQTSSTASTKGGLPNNTIAALVSGADGALWIGTGGLPRLTALGLAAAEPTNAAPMAAAPRNAAQDDLIDASYTGELSRVKALLAANADVNAKADALGGTALMAASGNGHLEVVRALLVAKADVNAASGAGITALRGGMATWRWCGPCLPRTPM
jgi:Ankyrin repeats (many copies)/Two component regulator propeller